MALAITDATTEFVSLAEVKRHLNIDDTDPANDDELDMLRSAAQEHVENLIGPVLHRTVTEQVRASGGFVTLGTVPVLSVTSLAATDGPITGYTPDVGAALLSNVRTSVNATVTYRVGRDSCPDAVRLATLIVAAHMWRTQLGNSPSALPDEEAGQGFDPSSADEVPSRARALLRPYLKPSGIA